MCVETCPTCNEHDVKTDPCKKCGTAICIVCRKGSDIGDVCDECFSVMGDSIMSEKIRIKNEILYDCEKTRDLLIVKIRNVLKPRMKFMKGYLVDQAINDVTEKVIDTLFDRVK